MNFKVCLIILGIFLVIPNGNSQVVQAELAKPLPGATEVLGFQVDMPGQTTGGGLSIQAGEGSPQVAELVKKGGFTVVSTDQGSVAREAVPVLGDSVVLVPYGDLVPGFKNTRVGKLFTEAVLNTKANMKKDPVGFILVTFGTGMDIFQWLHVTNMSHLNKTGNILFTMMMSIAFGYNKDKWAEATAPISSRIRRFFKNSPQWRNKGAQVLATTFASSLILGSGLYVSRALIFPANELLEFSSQLSTLSIPLGMSLITTLANFTWNEGIKNIDEKKHPGAKMLARSYINLKTIVLSCLATTAALMNPDVFGWTPWYAVGASGVAGFWFYKRFDAHYEWADKVGGMIGDRIEKLKGKLNRRMTSQPLILRCEGLL